MAMALLDAGFPPNRFRIDAVDISARALARARARRYGKNSFRGSELEFRDRHFEPTAHGSSGLMRCVAPAVHFQQGNLFDADSCRARQVYDVDLLPQRADLLRPRHAGSARSTCCAPADGGRTAVRRPVRDQPAARVTASSRHELPLAFAFRKAAAVRRGEAPLARQPARAPRRCPGNRAPAAIVSRPGRSSRRHRAPAPRPSLDRGPRARRPGPARPKPSGICESICAITARRRRRCICSASSATPTGNPPTAADCYRKALYLDPDHARRSSTSPCCWRSKAIGRAQGCCTSARAGSIEAGTK